MTDGGELLTLRQAAARLGVSKRTLERRLAQGLLPQAVKVGGEWRVPATPDALIGAPAPPSH